jgi:hypothetical protein
MQKNLFVIIETEKGFNITLENSQTKFFNEDIKTLKELFLNMSELSNR